MLAQPSSTVGGLRRIGLLVFPMGVLALGLMSLAAARQQPFNWATLGGAVLFAGGLIAAHLWVRHRLPFADLTLLPLAACLASLGQLMTSRLEPELGPRQGIWVLLGLAGLAAVTMLPSAGWLRRYRYTWAALAILLLLVTLVLGRDLNGSGARLWLVVGPINIQPTELVKILLVVFLAAYLEDYRELIATSGMRLGPLNLPPIQYLAPILLMAVIAMGVFVVQRDLGPALLFSAVLLAMLYMASGRTSYVLLGLGLILVAGFAADRLSPLVHVRVENWLDPWKRAQDEGYQMVQGLYGLASGGVFGSGLGQGAPRNIPAVHTDFVIAAIGEELGLVGSLAVVNLFVLFTVRGFHVALRARSGFNALLAAGLTAVFALQALVILAGALKLIPLTGITLPFVSYGGSSVLANFLLVGILLLVSHEEEAARLRA